MRLARRVDRLREPDGSGGWICDNPFHDGGSHAFRLTAALCTLYHRMVSL